MTAEAGRQNRVMSCDMRQAGEEKQSVWKLLVRYAGKIDRSYVATFVVEFLVLIAGLLTLKLSAVLLGRAGFGEYALCRRSMSLVGFTLLCGLGLSLPRHLGLLGGCRSVQWRQRRYLLAALWIGFVVLAPFTAAAMLWKDVFSAVLFGSAAFRHLMPPISLAITGLGLHVITYGYFRGQLSMWKANFLQVANGGVIPPLALAVSGGSAAQAITGMAAGWIASSAFWAITELWHQEARQVKKNDLITSARELLVYGLPRVPGEFLLFGLFSVPTLIVARREGVEAAGSLSLGFSMVQLVGAIFGGVGILLLPYTARLAAAHRWRRIDQVVSRTLLFALAVTLLLAGALAATADVTVPLITHRSFGGAIIAVRWLLFGALPYVVYLILRNPLDAISSWPHNTVNLCVTFLLIAGLLSLGKARFSVYAAVNAGLFLLGTLSLLSWRVQLAFTSGRARTFVRVPAYAPGSTESY